MIKQRICWPLEFGKERSIDVAPAAYDCDALTRIPTIGLRRTTRLTLSERPLRGIFIPTSRRRPPAAERRKRPFPTPHLGCPNLIRLSRSAAVRSMTVMAKTWPISELKEIPDLSLAIKTRPYCHQLWEAWIILGMAAGVVAHAWLGQQTTRRD